MSIAESAPEVRSAAQIHVELVRSRQEKLNQARQSGQLSPEKPSQIFDKNLSQRVSRWENAAPPTPSKTTL